MSKVVQAVNVMLANPDNITKVRPGSNSDEVFFVYGGKHKWSISSRRDQGEYWLYYYPGEIDIEKLAAIEDWDMYTNYVAYGTKELGTAEAKQSFAELYSTVLERRYNMNKVLDDIIKSK